MVFYLRVMNRCIFIVEWTKVILLKLMTSGLQRYEIPAN